MWPHTAANAGSTRAPMISDSVGAALSKAARIPFGPIAKLAAYALDMIRKLLAPRPLPRHSVVHIPQGDGTVALQLKRKPFVLLCPECATREKPKASYLQPLPDALLHEMHGSKPHLTCPACGIQLQGVMPDRPV